MLLNHTVLWLILANLNSGHSSVHPHLPLTLLFIPFSNQSLQLLSLVLFQSRLLSFLDLFKSSLHLTLLELSLLLLPIMLLDLQLYPFSESLVLLLQELNSVTLQRKTLEFLEHRPLSSAQVLGLDGLESLILTLKQISNSAWVDIVDALERNCSLQLCMLGEGLKLFRSQGHGYRGVFNDE
jgi:hypothetical protein